MSQETRKAELHLLGTYTRYSSWTSRVVLLLEYFHLPYKRTFIKLKDVRTSSNSGLVPLLNVKYDGDAFTIHDSLSICEFLAEQYPELHLWPSDWKLRALARSAAAEMHSGFTEIRYNYPTNFLAKYTGAIPISDKARNELTRLFTLWSELRETTIHRLKVLGQDDEGFLFGRFSIADAFYWPVLWRLRTYNLPLEDAPQIVITWLEKMWNDPVMQTEADDYFRQAEDPETVVEHYDNVFSGNNQIQYSTFERGRTFKYKKDTGAV